MADKKATILVADDDPRLQRLTQYTLEQQGFRVLVASDGPEALDIAKRELPDLILLDVMMPTLDGFEVLRRLRRDPRTQHIIVIFLTSKAEVVDKVRAFDAGANDYLVKPIDMTELEARVRSFLARARPAAAPEALPQGLVLCPFSLRGGMGVSSLAVNLAVSLAQLWQVDVPLVDLALESGHAALMLDLRPAYTWADLAGYSLEEVELPLVQGYLAPHDSGVHVLAAPPEPQAAANITGPLVNKVLTLLRDNYPFVVVDTPSNFVETTLAALDLAEHILLVLSPELAAVKSATQALEVFALLDYVSERVAPILNWVFPEGGLPRRDIEAALGLSIRAVIPYGRSLFVAGINRGIPVVLGAPTASPAMVIQQMAYHLSPAERQAQKPPEPSEMWLRLQRAQRR